MDLATEQIEPMTWLEGEALEWPVTAGGVTYIATYTTYYTFLYRTDGTQAGTQLLRRFDGDFIDVPTGFTHFDGVTYFVAEDDGTASSCGARTGPPEGTRLARDIVPGAGVELSEQHRRHRRLPVLHRRRRAVRARAVADPRDAAAAAAAPGEEPPVTISPLPVPGRPGAAPARAAEPLPLTAATLTIRAQRLRRCAERRAGA